MLRTRVLADSVQCLNIEISSSHYEAGQESEATKCHPSYLFVRRTNWNSAPTIAAVRYEDPGLSGVNHSKKEGGARALAEVRQTKLEVVSPGSVESSFGPIGWSFRVAS